MGFEIYKNEEAIIAAAETLVENNVIEGNGAEPFAKLLKDYKKLFKSTKRLVKMSDRNEEELNRVAKSLDEKSSMLEALSSKLAKYLSPQVYDSIFSGDQDASLKTSRKKLTVFFSDIKDFTQTTEDLQPEDLTYLINKYLTEMSKIALEHGATIDKFIGDAMLLFFGDPKTLGVQQDARACVKMAIAMQRRMQDLRNEWWGKGYEKPFEMRIGINTGFCNVGNFGSDDRMDYTIIGGEVNLAARLEAQAEPGGILMSYETYALVRDLIEAEEKEPIQVKGIRREVRPYAVKGIADNLEGERRYLRTEREGLMFMANLNKLKGKEREKAIKELEGMLTEMKNAD